MKPKKHILPVIILSQFACTTLWFAGNAVVDELAVKTGFGSEIVGYILSFVQLGFIVGTLIFALLMVADRFSPSRVFLVCAVLAALCNIALLSHSTSKVLLLSARFGTGFFMAGIYPVGMKIAADYYEHGLGKALGYLVGALVFGKSFPYLLKGMYFGEGYIWVIITASLMALFGGLLLWLLVPNGPYRMPSVGFRLRSGPSLFKITGFRKAAYGYFGHMWELYAFWGFVPFAIHSFNLMAGQNLTVATWAFVIIAVGGIACILGGYMSLTKGSMRVAIFALLLSGLCCLLSPLAFYLSPLLFLMFFCIWGMVVVADSAQFSSLVAAATPPDLRGTGLTLVNCIGFAISIVSIELLSVLSEILSPSLLFFSLAIGPVLGLWQLSKKKFH